MARIEIDLAWRIGGEAAGAELFALLRALRDHGSLTRAAARCGMSYRHAWGLLRRIETAFGRPLAAMERGRGAQLAPCGERLLAIDAQLAGTVRPALEAAAREFALESVATTGATAPLVRIHASHDMALSRLRDGVSPGDGLRIELQFRGSSDSLRALQRRQCDVAGFHVAESIPAPELARLLSAHSVRLIAFAAREQGLMVARGNPKRIRRIEDLGRRGIRVVNRQPGSGTRIVFDQLLQTAGLAPARLRGYRSEEFTHSAVAATIASGMADAGFGIRAAAAAAGIGFVALLRERYLFACSAASLRRPGVRALIGLLSGPRFRAIVAQLPGYDGAGAGSLVSRDEVFRLQAR